MQYCASPHSTYMDNAEKYCITASGVTMLDGALGKKQVWCPNVFEPEVFEKQTYCIEVLVTLFGLFGVRGSHSGPGNCALAHPGLRPYYCKEPRAPTSCDTQL